MRDHGVTPSLAADLSISAFCTLSRRSIAKADLHFCHRVIWAKSDQIRPKKIYFFVL
jgi:hypothetical protein